MDAIGFLFPKDTEDEMIDIYSHWRDKQTNIGLKNGLGNPVEEHFLHDHS